MKKNITIIIILVVLIAVGVLVASQKPAEAPEIAETQNTETVTQTTSGEIKEFTVHAGNFKYSMDEIKVKKGDTVRINFINDEGFHDWVVDEFRVATAKLQAGGTETVEFVADQAGTFEYYCSVGTHRQMGMKGNLVVEE